MCDGYAATFGKNRRTKKKKAVPRAHWTMLRISLILLAISTTVYVTVPDYPWGTPLWLALVGMAKTAPYNGWIHECFYIWTFFLVGIDLTYRFEKKSKEV